MAPTHPYRSNDHRRSTSCQWRARVGRGGRARAARGDMRGGVREPRGVQGRPRCSHVQGAAVTGAGARRWGAVRVSCCAGPPTARPDGRNWRHERSRTRTRATSSAHPARGPPSRDPTTAPTGPPPPRGHEGGGARGGALRLADVYFTLGTVFTAGALRGGGGEPGQREPPRGSPRARAGRRVERRSAGEGPYSNVVVLEGFCCASASAKACPTVDSSSARLSRVRMSVSASRGGS